ARSEAANPAATGPPPDPRRAARVLRRRAEPRRAQGDNAGAAAVLDRLLRLQPLHPAALLVRGILYREGGQPDKAPPLFRKVLAPDPRPQRTARHHLSLAPEPAGQTQEARGLMAEVRALHEADVLAADCQTQPTNLDLQVRAAQALLDRDSAAEALRLLEKVLASNPAHAPAHQLLARYYESQGQPE